MRYLAMLAVLMMAANIQAADVNIPEPLKPWKDWVLYEQEFRECPLVHGQKGTDKKDYACVWYGSLSLNAERQGASFRLPVEVITESLVRLPGSAEHWPREVFDGVKSLTVVREKKSPSVWLKPGRYELRGQFVWKDMPYGLAMPSELAVVELQLNGKSVVLPQWEDGAVLLGEVADEEKKKDDVFIEVFRKLNDGIPMMLETEVVFNVSGKAREQNFGVVLPEGFVPTNLGGELSARLSDAHELTVQLRPGEYRVQLSARATQFNESLEFAFPAQWADQEIWSWKSNERIRGAMLQGASPVDPQMTNMAQWWQDLPAYAVKSGEKLQLIERTRGRQITQNNLQLTRDLWLRFDGESFAFKDQLSGTLRRDWRLDMQAPYRLQSAFDNEKSYPLSGSEDGSFAGFEIRTTHPVITATGELARAAEIPINGWRTDFDLVNTTLHLPPGYRLFMATGVEHTPEALIEQWNLFWAFMFVLSVVLVYKLTNTTYASLFALSYFWLFHEPDMPTGLLLNLLLVLLAAKHVTGKFEPWIRRYRMLSIAVFLFAFVPFIAYQARVLLHPQLEIKNSYQPLMAFSRADVAQEGASPEIDMAMVKPKKPQAQTRKEVSEKDATKEERIVVTGSRIKRADLVSSYSENLFSSAGKGVPAWSWNQYRLNWQHSVNGEQTMSLWILSYGLRASLLTASMIVFTLVFLQLIKQAFNWRGSLKQWTASAPVVIVLFALLGVSPNEVRAEYPSDAMLKELKQRLTKVPLCVPDCVELTQAGVNIDSQRITVRMDVRAEATTTLAIPGRVGQWWPTIIERDGARVYTFWRNNSLHIRVPKGSHQFQLSGPISATDRLTLDFPERPVRTVVSAKAWDVTGLSGDQLPNASLTLIRLADKKTADNVTVKAARVAPFYRVERSLLFDKTWMVVTMVQRLAPEVGALTVQIPLLSGEKVLGADFGDGWRTDGLEIADGKIHLNFAHETQSVRFESNLERAEKINLQAAENVPWVEFWELAPSNLWRVEAEGTPQIHNEDYDDWLMTYAPRAGESLSVSVIRPSLLDGQALAVNQLGWSQTDAAHQQSGQFNFSYRATKAGEHPIVLSKNWEITQIAIDGKIQLLRPTNAELRIPITPGQHSVRVDYKDNAPLGLLRQSPELNLNIPVANLALERSMPADRWILFVSGPSLGPAVLYWSALLLFVLIALAFSKAKLLPITATETLLLGLGFSTVSWPILVAIFVWLMLMRWRQRSPFDITAKWFNVKQVALITVSVFVISALMGAVPYALLGSPDMMLQGNDSYENQLRWFQDYSAGELPSTLVFSVPLWIYKGAMLLWAIWLSFALLRWVKFSWQALNTGGFWAVKAKVLASASSQQASTVPPPTDEPKPEA